MSQRRTAVGIEGLDAALSADHTWSTEPAIEEVKDQFGTITAKLSLLRGVRFAVLDHGDYDERDVNKLDFTDNLPLVHRHLRGIRPSGGCGRGASYAQTLQAARQLNWRPGANRCLILAGDEIPRPPEHYRGSAAVKAEDELELIEEMGVKVFAVQLLGLRHATRWYQRAGRSGLYLPLEQMYQLPTVVIGICLFQQSPDLFDQYALEVSRCRGYTQNMEFLFDAVRGRKASTRRIGVDVPVLPKGVAEMDPHRFQIMTVSGPEVSIADFVRSRNLRFNTGRGFYLHDYRDEKVQDYKEIVLRHQVTGKWYAAVNEQGRAGIRGWLGIPLTGTAVVPPNPLAGWDVWIQSTSPNRTLNRDGRSTEFAYEVNDDGPSTSAAALKARRLAAGV